MKIAAFHPGTQHSWQTALALQQLDRLAWYATSIFYQPDHFPYVLERFAPPAIARRLHAEFRRFSHPSLDPSLVRTVGLAEWGERLLTRAGLHQMARRMDRYGNRRFVDRLASAVSSNEPFALWGYNASSLETFELGKLHGRTCILDRTNGDFRSYNALMATLQDSYGDWFTDLERAVPDEVLRKDQREYELADVILTGSEFAAATVREQGGAQVAAKTRVLHYCFDEHLFGHLPAPSPTPANKPVRFLFLGQVIPRKGIHHVLEAIAQIPREQAELTIVGPMRLPPKVFAAYADRVTYRPTVARADVPGIMRDHDVFLLPSYFEGAGIVLYEALAAGCGLIQSRNCAHAATADTGIMMDRIDTPTLLAAMLTVVEDRARLAHWRANAQTEAARYTFAHYRDNIAAMLKDILPD